MTSTFEVVCSSSPSRGLISEVFIIYKPAQEANVAASSDYRERLCLPPYSLGLEKGPQITLYYIMNIRQVVCIYKFFKKYFFKNTGETFTMGQKPHIDIVGLISMSHKEKLRGSKLINDQKNKDFPDIIWRTLTLKN